MVEYLSEDILKELLERETYHAEHSGNLCRHALYATFAAAWALLLKDEAYTMRYLLYLTMILIILYLIFEAFYNFHLADIVRTFYEEIKTPSLTERQVQRGIKKIADESFKILRRKMFATILIVLCLATYVIFNYT